MTSTPIGGRPNSDKGTFVREMFARIAPRYDVANRVLTAGMDERWRRRAIALLALPPGARVLDLCCGTGDVVFHLLRIDPTLDVTGIDFCAPMLDRARERAGHDGAQGHLRRRRRDVAAVPRRQLRRRDDGLQPAQRRRHRSRAARDPARPQTRRAIRQPRRQQGAEQTLEAHVRRVLLPRRAAGRRDGRRIARSVHLPAELAHESSQCRRNCAIASRAPDLPAPPTCRSSAARSPRITGTNRDRSPLERHVRSGGRRRPARVGRSLLPLDLLDRQPDHHRSGEADAGGRAASACARGSRCWRRPRAAATRSSTCTWRPTWS